ncbi:hydroxyacid dehydrogenase [Fodinisporobacter ferrooxydans]|uniref:Hydroxyacid dehydrogenase n=1 Tax=Fodinisporobacter ferrooxydans TaxID=2901836 RepID=A0ABY4CID5_9BACL|nr:hydroxyacid dehydrogenase [Alicyclobacillaceae bacterium MYW30-H2]
MWNNRFEMNPVSEGVYMMQECPWSTYIEHSLTDQMDLIRQYWEHRSEKIIVLDDDPTGCQTVHGIRALMNWDRETLRQALEAPEHLVYILTNLRSVDAVRALEIHREIADRIVEVAAELKIKVHVISRSDSTLRGHFPEDVLPFINDSRFGDIDGILLSPAFFEGGRFTYNGTHYVKQGNAYLPADQTEFAKDPAFPFTSAYLPRWIAEKWPTVNQQSVVVLSLEQIRSAGIDAVIDTLMQATNQQVIAVDAVDDADLQVVALACLECRKRGKRFFFRTAASFVRAYAGITRIDPLPVERVVDRTQGTGGLVLVGSFVNKTTSQLQALLDTCEMVQVEMHSESLLQEQREREIQRVIRAISEALQAGKDVVCFTSRTLVQAKSAQESLYIGRRIMDAIVQVVRELPTRPAFFVAKGGITSHTIASDGLSVQQAWVAGQALPGVPVWELGSESKWPHLHYIVFPGNVGDTDALARLIERYQSYRQMRQA